MSDRLRDISKIGVVRIRVFLDESAEITDLIRSGSDQPPALQVLLVLYGKRAIANAIGKILSRARIYLQHPVLIDSGVMYENPHHFKTPKNTAATVFNGAHISLPTIQTNLPAQPYIEQVLQTLEQNTSLHELEPDVRIKTKLLPYVIHKTNDHKLTNYQPSKGGTMFHPRTGKESTYRSTLTLEP